MAAVILTALVSISIGMRATSASAWLASSASAARKLTRWCVASPAGPCDRIAQCPDTIAA